MKRARHSGRRGSFAVLAAFALVAFSCESDLPIPGCGQEREFTPMDKPNKTDSDELLEGEEAEQRASGGGTTDDSTQNPNAPNSDLDGGTAGTGGDVASASSELTVAEAKAFLTKLESGLPKPGKKLFKALCRECAAMKGCAGECKAALSSCDSPESCAGALTSGCPPFAQRTKGKSGEALTKQADFYVRELWGEMVVKARLALPDKDGERLDAAAERYGL